MLSEHGYTVEDRSRQNLGYDLYVEKEGRKYYIEVKLIDYAGQPFIITTNEETVARECGNTYFMALTLRDSNDGVQCVQFINDPSRALKFVRQCRQWVWECSEYEFKTNIPRIKMTLFEKFQNTYPNDWLEISQSLAGAIVANDSKQMEVLIAKYFSSAATLKLLEGTIAFDFISYQQNQSECLVSAPAFLAVRSNKQNVLAEILKATKNPNARMMSENSGTLLMVSAECGNEEATKYLLSIEPIRIAATKMTTVLK
ncbi:MAG: DUF3883 domain-containing protein [Dechloromonas sp.]|uniref:DUF3883 domain-containing protein n=1 Tax=Candidatus Dechloromonas phosphorivorans TaxID=2899244 RepID=A0A935JU73_9RHOO|nr:DUF3883 domain-containing protein [Candidatus Dechloromonas phosphorivorans]